MPMCKSYCPSCDRAYVGITEKQAETRMMNHLKAAHPEYYMRMWGDIS